MPFNIRNSDGKWQVDTSGNFYLDDDCCCEGPVSGAFYHCLSGPAWAAGDHFITLSGSTPVMVDDYLWIWGFNGLNTQWHPCYLSGSAGTPTTAYILEQCGTAPPTACADLTGWRYADTYDGVGCSSDSNYGINFDIQWNNTQTGVGSTITIDDANDWMRFQTSSVFTATLDGTPNSNTAGDFVFITTIEDPQDYGASNNLWWRMYMLLAGISGPRQPTLGVRNQAGQNQVFYITAAGTIGSANVTFPTDPFHLKIERLSGLIKYYHDIGGSWDDMGYAGHTKDTDIVLVQLQCDSGDVKLHDYEITVGPTSGWLAFDPTYRNFPTVPY